ncbi:MAG: glycosyltransferase family 2 protein, partial [Chloroflexi bacterium]|nr:glycosyltransferase family 2 protein [Chloroflexota bacterium]
MTSAAPGVSIIVVTWNGRNVLAGCLAALAMQSYADVETIVVDNGSTDGTVAMVQSCYPGVRLIENVGNVGFAAANAQALPHCRGRYIALVNNDTEASPGWLAALVAALDQAPRAAGACGTVVRLGRTDEWLSTTPKIDPRAARAIWVAQPAPACCVDTLAGNSMLMRRAVIDQIGFLDPAYVAYYEETDWCARAIRA